MVDTAVILRKIEDLAGCQGISPRKKGGRGGQVSEVEKGFFR
jgi:hypothetical protein